MYVQFDDQRSQSRPEQKVSAYARALIQLGIVQSPKQANNVLIVIAIALMFLAYVIWQSTMVSENPANNLTPEQLEQAGAPSEIAN